MTDTEILNFIEAHSVNFFRVERDQMGRDRLRVKGPIFVTQLAHWNPEAYLSGEGADLRSSIADLIAKNPAVNRKETDHA